MATERELTDAKLEAVEARVDARLISIDAKLDRLADQLANSTKMSVEASQRAEGAALRAENQADEARKAAGNTKWNILLTGVAVAGVCIAMFMVYTGSVDNLASLIGMKPAETAASQQ